MAYRKVGSAQTLQMFKELESDVLRNYVIPGLKSSLFEDMTVRMFEQEIVQLREISPHNHRFNFASLVLSGTVHNTIWEEVNNEEAQETDPKYVHEMSMSELTYLDNPGDYSKALLYGLTYWKTKTYEYQTGDWYFMTTQDYHTITFDKGTKVMVFQSPDISRQSYILEPVLPNGDTVPLSTIDRWMFQKEE